ncbi:hypothetical protein AKJ16_DCAP21935 [Drosera capensis]
MEGHVKVHSAKRLLPPAAGDGIALDVKFRGSTLLSVLPFNGILLAGRIWQRCCPNLDSNARRDKIPTSSILYQLVCFYKFTESWKNSGTKSGQEDEIGGRDC